MANTNDSNKFNDVLRSLSENKERVIDEALKASGSLYLPVKNVVALGGNPDEVGGILITPNGKIHVHAGNDVWKEYVTMDELIAAIGVGAAGGGVFTEGFTIFQAGNTLGLNGTVVTPGTKINDFLKFVFVQSVAPSATLALSTSSKPYNEINFSIGCTLGYTINTPGTSIVNWKLEFSRNNTSWTTLLNTNTEPTVQYVHNLGQLTPNNNIIYYKSTVTDNNGKSASAYRQVNFASYQVPAVTLNPGALLREKGNISSTITGTITKTSPNIDLVSYKLQYRVNNGTWVDLITETSFTASGPFNKIHTDLTLSQANTIDYRVLVTDQIGVSTSNLSTITFDYLLFFGPVTTATTAPQEPKTKLSSVLLSNFGVQQQFATGIVAKMFEIIIPTSYMLDTLFDSDVANFITGDYTLVDTNFSVNDYNDNPKNSYYLYRLTQTTPFNPGRDHIFKIKAR